MRIAMFLIWQKISRPAPRPRGEVLITDWTVRDWADLPVYHPRKD